MDSKQSQGILKQRVPLSVASRLAMASLVAMALAELIGVLLSQGEHPPIALVIELLLLALAGLVYTRRWWASAIAAGLSGIFVLLSISSLASTLAGSRIPEFIFAIIFMGLALVATITGIQATVQNYRNMQNEHV
jgi:hypothetical protein